MSYSVSVVLKRGIDPQRIRDALIAARDALAAKRPAWADTTVAEPRVAASGAVSFEVVFTAALVTRPGGEIDTPGAPHEDGRYWCMFELYSDDEETSLGARSNRSWNQDAWITLTELLADAGDLLGGKMRDY